MTADVPSRPPFQKRRLLWGLAAIVLGLFFIGDLFLPDCIPAVDEIVAGALTVVSAYKALKGYLPGRKAELPPPAKD